MFVTCNMIKFRRVPIRIWYAVMRRGYTPRPVAANQHETVTLPRQLGGHAGITLIEDEEIHGGALAVQHVHPNDLAARAGIRPGDVLCAINDVPVTTAAAAVATMDASKEPLVLTYLPAEVANAERQSSREHGDRPGKERPVMRVLVFVYAAETRAVASGLVWLAHGTSFTVP